MKWLVLPYSESYFEETKYMLVKFYQFSCNQEYYKTKSIWKRVWIVYNFSAFVICQHSCRISVLCAHFLLTHTRHSLTSESAQGFCSVPHLLWYWTPIYNAWSSPRTTLDHTYCRAFKLIARGAVITCFCCGWDSKTQPSTCSNWLRHGGCVILGILYNIS